MSIKKERFLVKDMHCPSCEKIIENNLKKKNGILNVIANYEKSLVFVEYDSQTCTKALIIECIENSGYSVKTSKNTSDEIINIIGILAIVIIILMLGKYSGGFNMESKLQQEVTFIVLFVVGVFTSIHCVGMCGGIMLSQSITSINNSKWQTIKPALLYNLGRIISYTILGGIIGAIGTVLSISLQVKSLITIFAGAFMILMGINMAGFNFLRKLHIRLPWSACSVKNKSKMPFVVGLLNGLMPCGPLQTMQLYALGTGSALKGALSMFAFSLGTVPLMLSFGLATNLFSKGYSKKIFKFSGILVVLLGFIMTNRGLALSGINLLPENNITTPTNPSTRPDSNSEVAFAKAEIKNGVQIVKMTANFSGYSPNVLYVQKNIPVKWIIDGEGLTSCNNEIIVPSMNIQQKLQVDENIIEFNPGDKDINFSCWMGMIRGIIKVVDDLDTVDTSNVISETPPSSSSSYHSDASTVSSKEVSNKQSIYGDGLSILPTSKLIKKAEINGDFQNIEIKGIGYELDPLVVVANKDMNLNLSIDLTYYENLNSNFSILDISSNDVVQSIPIEGANATKTFSLNKIGGYAIIQDNYVLGVIEVVESMDSVDLENIRDKYLK